ncbi:MCE family protein [Mycolicibacterium stellerae]|uniref:MCE family protein n=1 Tax=Mycolicibacterium stellerae TaxID=2358193 RepID=UPI000F0BAF66|nr:MCE family protein [Mycolicibacterium stellerae]
MISREVLVRVTATLLTVSAVVGSGLLVYSSLFRAMTVTAFFTSATAIYPGDEVRVSGVKVGEIDSINADGAQIGITMKIAHDVPVPADAKAVIVAQNLVSARYVQLTPAYRSTGPRLQDGAVIPAERTAVPVEWDEVKDQIMRLATELGPTSEVSTPAVAKFIDSAASAMDGNGEKLRAALAQMSAVGRILAEGGGNIVDILKNLNTFVAALKDSNQQIVEFENRLATLSSVLDDNRSDLDAAVSDLSTAVVDVERFIANTRDKTSEQVQRLANVTQTLVDHRLDLENVLHITPNALANGYNIYNPDTGSGIGSFSLINFANPLHLICGAIGAIENATAPETAKLCAQYFGPALHTVSMNFPPLPINPYLGKSASPGNIIYTDPSLAPGGSGPADGPPETPPAISAYTGSAETPVPAAVPDLLLPAGSIPPPPSTEGAPQP